MLKGRCAEDIICTARFSWARRISTRGCAISAAPSSTDCHEPRVRHQPALWRPRSSSIAAASRRAFLQHLHDGDRARRGGFGRARGRARRQRRRRAVQLRRDGACARGRALGPAAAQHAQRRAQSNRTSAGITATRRFRGTCATSTSPNTAAADLRGKSDEDCAIAMLAICDARFIDDLADSRQGRRQAAPATSPYRIGGGRTRRDASRCPQALAVVFHVSVRKRLHCRRTGAVARVAAPANRHGDQACLAAFLLSTLWRGRPTPEMAPLMRRLGVDGPRNSASACCADWWRRPCASVRARSIVIWAKHSRFLGLSRSGAADERLVSAVGERFSRTAHAGEDVVRDGSEVAARMDHAIAAGQSRRGVAPADRARCAR